jgi:putative transposase
VAGREEPYRSAIREHLKGHTQALEELAIELLARGLSVRDIEDAFKDESGRLLLSKTAVWELGERLWEDYQAFARQGREAPPHFARTHISGEGHRTRRGAPMNPRRRPAGRHRPRASRRECNLQ